MPAHDVQRDVLDSPPSAARIAEAREAAAAAEASMELTFPVASGGEKRLVVSPRGTVVLLNDVSEATFNQSESAESIASALPE